MPNLKIIECSILCFETISLSAGAIDLGNALESRLHLLLPSTLVFDYPTAAAMADHIATLQHSPTNSATIQLQQPSHPSPGTYQESAGTFNGALVQSAVHRLASGAPTAVSATAHDACVTLPLTRWDSELGALYAPASTGQPHVLQVRFAHLLEGVQDFDAALCAVSGAEAALMDPQQRLLLESVAEALLGGSQSSTEEMITRRGECGVFVGSSWMDYGRLMRVVQGVTPYSATGVS